ncbi:MAG: hypothetical protein CVV44_11110 [Spirochaetae bacterium HGW-Spirochaetae-1]|nr:MAG: hypothetical protein CVV44_11110 [Spirochaetae bacterium HGW-Spirochaetae-1]
MFFVISLTICIAGESMSEKIDRIAVSAVALLKITGSIMLAAFWFYFVVVPQVRAFYLVRWTEPAELAIDEVSANKPSQRYISLTGTFMPRQARRIVETGDRVGSITPEKDTRHFFPLCDNDRSACIYYGTDDLSWEPPAYTKITMRGIVKDFGERESMQMTLLHAKDMSDFNAKHPVTYRLKKDGTPDWDYILARYGELKGSADRVLPTMNSWYIHDEHDYSQSSFVVFILIATLGVLLVAGGMFSSGLDAFRKPEQSS